MADMRSKLNTLYSLEQLASKNTVLHSIHPMAKLLVTAVYLVCVVSLPRTSFTELTPFLFYPVIMMALGEIPYSMIFKRSIIALPFCIFAGISNVIFDHEVMMVLGGVHITAGVVSMITLVFRTLLCVSAVLILVALTPFNQLTDQLRRVHIPELCVSLIEMLYRYIGVLLGEASSMVVAFRLRGHGRQWPDIRQFGQFVGQLLLRSADRAERIYNAMQCRCYQLRDLKKNPIKWKNSDKIFLIVGCLSAVLFRFFNITSWLGGIF